MQVLREVNKHTFHFVVQPSGTQKRIGIFPKRIISSGYCFDNSDRKTFIQTVLQYGMIRKQDPLLMTLPRIRAAIFPNVMTGDRRSDFLLTSAIFGLVDPSKTRFFLNAQIPPVAGIMLLRNGCRPLFKVLLDQAADM